MKNLLILTFLLAIFAGCTYHHINHEAEAEKLIQLSREWAQAASSRDIEKIVNFWAEDAVVMMPDQPTLRGHQDLRPMVESSMQIPGFEVKWEPEEAVVSESGDLGYVLTHNSLEMPDSLGNPVTTYNKGVEIWKKQDDGSWKCVVDIFNAEPTISSLK